MLTPLNFTDNYLSQNPDEKYGTLEKLTILNISFGSKRYTELLPYLLISSQQQTSLNWQFFQLVYKNTCFWKKSAVFFFSESIFFFQELCWCWIILLEIGITLWPKIFLDDLSMMMITHGQQLNCGHQFFMRVLSTGYGFTLEFFISSQSVRMSSCMWCVAPALLVCVLVFWVFGKNHPCTAATFCIFTLETIRKKTSHFS